MLERFRDFWTNVWKPLAHLLIRLGVTLNMVTFFGTVGVVAGALVFFPRGELLIGVLVITAFVFSDLIAGYMARLTGITGKFGSFWDSTLDRLGDGAIFGGLAPKPSRPCGDSPRQTHAPRHGTSGSVVSRIRVRRPARSWALNGVVTGAERLPGPEDVALLR
jgi:CDP-diacylglycerol--glycerol-3-phosphate 3-phosphatidyltransferase